MEIRAIGVIRTGFTEAKGTPIQPSSAEGAPGTVEVFPEFAEGLKDLEGFERVWLIYWFHRALPGKLVVKPYLDNVEHGVFATRAPARPNPIGMSCVRLVRIEGAIMQVADADMLDGTPLLDIKPYAPKFDSYEVRRVGWLTGKKPGETKADERFFRKDEE